MLLFRVNIQLIRWQSICRVLHPPSHLVLEVSDGVEDCAVVDRLRTVCNVLESGGGEFDPLLFNGIEEPETDNWCLIFHYPNMLTTLGVIGKPQILLPPQLLPYFFGS